jgi:hypothetical protein
MNRIFRGMAGLIVAFGASACASDPTLEFNGENNTVQVTPQVLFVNQGDRDPILVRLVNDRNQSTPAAFVVSNVGAGITVEFDDTYRPDNVNPEGTLQPNELQSQHRFYVTANDNVMATFTVSTGSFSTEVTVRVIPGEVGSLSSAAPAIGEEVTIAASGSISFATEGANASTVSFSPGGDAVITSLTAKSVTFIPIPGSGGVATMDHVTLDYAPTLGDYTLSTANEIAVPAVTSIPLSYSSGNVSADETVTVSAAGFNFEDDVSFTFNGAAAFILSIAGDGSSAVILAPTGLAAGKAVVSNVHLSSLTAVSLVDLPSDATLTTGSGYAQVPGTDVASYLGGGQPEYAVPAPGTGMFIADNPIWGDLDWYGGNPNRPTNWYKLNVTGTGDRTITVGWNNNSDIDFCSVNEAATVAIHGAFSGDNPESDTQEFENGMSYWVLPTVWSGAFPDEMLITVK